MATAGFAGLTVSLVAYGVLAYGLDALAAMVGLQEAAWPYVGTLIWAVRIVSAAGAIAVGIRCRAWFKRTTRGKRYIFMTLWVPLFLMLSVAAGFWANSRVFDSDYMLVSRGMINEMLPDRLEIPEAADNIHAIVAWGIDPSIALRFDLSPEKAEQYLADAMRMAKTENYVDWDAQYVPGSFRPSRLGGNKDWWDPDEEGQWWAKVKPNRVFFVQRQSDGRTLYVYYSAG